MNVNPKTGLVLVLVGTLLIATAASSGEFKPRKPAIKPTEASIAPGFSRHLVEVKFVDELDIGLSGEGVPYDRADQVLKLRGADVVQSITAAGGEWARTSATAEDMVDFLVARAERRLSRDIADLNNYFVLTVPEGIVTEDWIDQLNSLPEVEVALAMPLAPPLPVPDNYQPLQGYLNDAPDGIGAASAWSTYSGAGGNGSGCFGTKICDFEYSWNLDHNDIMASYSELIPTGYTPVDPYTDDNHGTAVLGVMTSFNDALGTTGASYGGTAWAAPTNFATYGWQIGTALLHVLPKVYWQPGAVFLIEQQFPGPNYTGLEPYPDDGLIPVEWWQSWYEAIVTCVGNGVTVVECAGNGREDLDDAIYGTGNGGHWPFLSANNSGAIIVGAGAAPAAFGGTDTPRSRMWFSNYGSRVDLQGWGERVMTTGYGNYYSGDGKNYWYEDGFSGTSSAAPIVASSAAILQSVYKEQGGCQPSDIGTALSPSEVLSILETTGTPQQAGTYPTSQNIGPLPNLVTAIAALPSQGCCVIRGDVDHSGALPIDIADLVYLVDFMFNSGPEPECFDEGDVDASGVEPIDIADLVYLVDYMFNEGPTPPPCP
ncbi:MAG: S8 family serine peptidase [candidate division Zixibacteria bacterium]|nr:S8 family serine peptidase [candidate division Zixibacteria bacterium]